MARRRDEYDYRQCADEDCPRFPCRVYQEGFRQGFAAGYAAGNAQGEADGFAQGFTAGMDAAHTGRA